MTEREGQAKVRCTWCGAENPPTESLCGTCLRSLPASAGTAGRSPSASGTPSRVPRAREEWEQGEEPSHKALPVIVGLLAIVVVGVIQPGLGVLLALCAIPVLVMGGAGHGMSGCLTTALFTGGILLATGIAFFITCMAVVRVDRGRDGYGGSSSFAISMLVGAAVFVGLTAWASVVMKRSRARRRTEATKAMKREAASAFDDDDPPTGGTT